MPQPLASKTHILKKLTPPLELSKPSRTKALILKHLTQFKGPRPHQAGGSRFLNDVDGWNFTGKQFGYKTPFKTGKTHTHI